MDQIGYLDAPSGVVPDFNRGLTSVQIIIIVLFSVTYALATLFLVLRLYTSAFINKGVDVGDCELDYPELEACLLTVLDSLGHSIMGCCRYFLRLFCEG